MKDSRNLYEGMFIISPTLSDDARSKSMERIKAVITDHGGEVLKEHDLHRKRMAYDIKGHKDAYYFLLYFELGSTALSEVWKEWHLNEDLLRFMTLRAEKVLENIKFKPLAEVE